LVALPSKYADKPDLFHFSAFVAEPGQVVNVKPGIWHSQPVPIDGNGEFMVLAWETGASSEVQTATLTSKIVATL
jgi:ureidoglycolate hydrolase